jgi:hypothetical protein
MIQLLPIDREARTPDFIENRRAPAACRSSGIDIANIFPTLVGIRMPPEATIKNIQHAWDGG